VLSWEQRATAFISMDKKPQFMRKLREGQAGTTTVCVHSDRRFHLKTMVLKESPLTVEFNKRPV
jgi:hypothetical protein